jgi:group I intron endonuclease
MGVEFKGVIYKIVNMINGDYYIGKTTSKIRHRLRRFWSPPKNYNMKIVDALKIFGRENFVYAVIDTSAKTLEQLNQLEKDYITFYGKSYNVADGGSGVCPKGANKDTHPWIRKTFEKLKGRKKKDYLYLAASGEKASERMKGRKISPAHIEKIILANTGRKHSLETKEKIRVSNIITKTKKVNPELFDWSNIIPPIIKCTL